MSYSGSCSHTGVTSSTINVSLNALKLEEQAGAYTTDLIIQTFEMVVTCNYGAFKGTRVSQEERRAETW